MRYLHASCTCGLFFPFAQTLSLAQFEELKADMRKAPKRAVPHLRMRVFLHERLCKNGGVKWRVIDTDAPDPEDGTPPTSLRFDLGASGRTSSKAKRGFA